jgi:hypothetical protein
MTRCATPTQRDLEAVEAFTNFLSWGERPASARDQLPPDRRNVPPAWYAYVLGYTTWCPPKDEL